MDFDDDDGSVELPCEFCEVLFPWSLLHEHQIVCELNPEVRDFIPFFPEENVIVENPKIKEDVKVKQVPVINVPLEPAKPVVKPVEKIIPAAPVELPKVVQKVPVEPPKVASKNVQNRQNQFQRFTSQTEELMTKTGEKLLVYGADIDPVEDLDAEKKSSKIPNQLTSNVPKEEDVVDINNLSDDDSEETLEDFWKRARDFLKRNKTKIEC